MLSITIIKSNKLDKIETVQQYQFCTQPVTKTSQTVKIYIVHGHNLKCIVNEDVKYVKLIWGCAISHNIRLTDSELILKTV